MSAETPSPVAPSAPKPGPGASSPVHLVCQGDYREMGFEQGTRLGCKVRMAREVLDRLEVFRRERPPWLPYAWFRLLACWRAKRYLSGPMSRVCPDQHERLLGLAEGAEMPASELYLVASLESGLCSVHKHLRDPVAFACSAVGIGRTRSGSGQVLMAHNFDYLPVVAPLYIIRESRPTGGFRSLEFTLTPLAGAVDGINEHGLAITYDYAFPRDQPLVPVPISTAIAGALARCRTVVEAARWIADRPRWGGALLLLGDAQGDLASLELSNTGSQLRRPEGNHDILHHTNCYRTAEMRSRQIPAEAVFGSRAPEPLRGTSVLGPHETRHCRLGDLLAGGGRIGLEDLSTIMADHGDQGIAGGGTPCVHTEYWETSACLQFVPAERRLRVSWGSACQSQFLEAAL